ncbi:hypothetical protein CERSUDRAFT_48433 [Gelatoporia subvermispora B]|uniref:CxC1-like cysteine cluster associated with KDZ transposases domain-containing protein n=1 Tax=Ceriporiopsis subvermispora (strain B) TaxID=914234 RepID=M2QLS7_CERS8|nr:hypothetical protein CERSUDRAFT_48433 [Gelatoporia subvermispora B]
MAPSLRNQQPYVPGMGKVFVTPKKRQAKAADQAPVHYMGRDLEIEALKKRLQRLETGCGSRSPTPDASHSAPGPSSGPVPSDFDIPDISTESPVLHDDAPECPSSPSKQSASKDEETERPRKRRRPAPKAVLESLYSRWQVLLPSLVDPLLAYLRRTAGTSVPPEFQPVHECLNQGCATRMQDVILLFWDHYATVSVPFCACVPLSRVLVTSGMFPMAPSQPRIAVSIDLLDLYLSLFERSGDAVTALARALRHFYMRRGWRILDHNGRPIADPFRKLLGRAIQWYDSLRILIEQTIEDAIDQARSLVSNHLASQSPAGSTLPNAQSLALSSTTAIDSSNTTSIPDHASTSVPADDPRTASPPQSAASILQRRCPACFGSDQWGRPFSDGGDVVLAVDGNFSHRHLRSAGDSPAFYQPEYFLPKSQIDAIGERIDALRKKSPSSTYIKRVPDEAVDNCERGHEAADESKVKTPTDHFDDTGVMAIICTHDIPLFMANIDTPGEQMKYAVGLIEHVATLLPENATIGLLYDIACKCERSIGLWSCQIVYNPRLCPGFGLRDGEGVERLWSRLRVFIPVTRTSGRSRRIWILDRQVRAIGIDLRENLGVFIVRKYKHGVREQRTSAKAILDQMKTPIAELRDQWTHQREAQLSVRAHAPARLKKEVNAVITLQTEIDRVDEAIEAISTQLSAENALPQCETILGNLRRTSAELGSRAEMLYSSLNVGAIFPELKGINAELVRMLILTRDIKVNIRKRVTAQLLEYDRIDRAAGGKDNPLGTKLHQQTRKAIQKRQPAILSAIRKYNKYCATIEQLISNHIPKLAIPVPRPLSTDLTVLRESSDLFEDVWITTSPAAAKPKWLEDSDVRLGIRAMLKQDRCAEEEGRLRREANNLHRWFGLELAAIEVAMKLSDST